MKKLFICFIMFFVLFSGCASLNDNSPAYVKEVVAYKEGSEGLMIYFILADSSGSMTTSDGYVTLTISETHSEWSSLTSEYIDTEITLYSASFEVKKTNFQKAKVGVGAFEHEVILCSLGRIDYSSFRKRPSEISGKVKIEFQTHNALRYKGEDTIFF